MKIGITTDCSSSIEYASFKHNCKVTRTTIHFGEKEYVDGVDIKADEFYEKLVSSDIIPSTSAPTPKELIGKALEWKAEGCTDVIHFPISFKLSKYGENLLAMKDDYVEGINYHVFDCKTGCMVEGYVAHYAEILASHGYTVEQIFECCNKLINQAETYMIVDDLKYLVKNGRLNGAAGTIGSLLHVKPILLLNNKGTIDTFEKVRTSAKAIDRTVEVVNEKTKDAKEVIYIVQQSLRPEDGEALRERCKQEYSNGVKYDLTVVTPTIGCHIGGRVIALCYIVLDGLDFKDELAK